MKPRLFQLTSVRSAFSHTGFARYMTTNMVSLLGLWIHRIALGWLTWEMTRSDLWVGAMAFADLFPVLIIGPFAGVLADRLDRKKILVVCQGISFVQAGALSLLVWTDVITIWLLFGLSLFQGMVVAVQQPARLSLIPNLVPARDLSTAVAIGSSAFNLARLVGPALAGLLIAFHGTAPAFMINALTYALMLVVLLFISPHSEERPDARGRGIFQDIGEGLTYIRDHGAIAPLIVILILTSILARPVFELLPGYADGVLGRGEGGFAVLASATGLGALLASIFLAVRGGLRGLVTFSVWSMIISGIATAGLGILPNFYLAALLMMIYGAAINTVGLGTQTLIQSVVAGHMRARVLGIWGLIFRGVPAAGAVLIGWMGQQLGLTVPFILAGVVTAGLGIAFLKRKPALVALLRALKDKEMGSKDRD